MMITSGALFGTIGAVVLILIIGGISFALYINAENNFEIVLSRLIVGVGTSMVLITYNICMWPFEAEYHFWQETNGSITQIERRMIGDGSGGMQEVFPLKLTGHKDVYRVDDSRAATFKIGDEVKLLCKRAYDFAGYDGWTCKIGEM